MCRPKCNKLGQLLGGIKWALVDVWVVQWGEKRMDNGLFLFMKEKMHFIKKDIFGDKNFLVVKIQNYITLYPCLETQKHTKIGTWIKFIFVSNGR